MKLTAGNVKTLIAPAGKDDVVIWDDDLPGFGVRLRGGNRTFWFNFASAANSVVQVSATFAK